MFDRVTRYRTSDGKLHETEKQAQDNIHDRACSIIERQTDHLLKTGHMTRSDQVRLINHLFKDHLDVRALRDDLNSLFTDGDSNAD